MISRMIVTGLAALYLSLYTAGRTPAPLAQTQQPQPAHPSKSLRIFIEEDFSTAQMLKMELTDWSIRIGIPIIFVEKDVEPYDLRRLLTSGVGSDSGSCTSPCSCSSLSTDISCSCTSYSSSCSVTI